MEVFLKSKDLPFALLAKQLAGGCPEIKGFHITRFVRACAGETHMVVSQEPFCAEIYRENAGRSGYHLD